MPAYCEAADLYDHGLPRGGLPNPGRVVDAVVTGTEVMTLDGHGFREDAELVFRAEEGGSLPSPLAEGTTYYAIPLTDATFSVAASAGGAAVNLTTEGVMVIVTTPLPVTAAIEWASAWVDEQIPHVLPLEEPYPKTIVAAVADLATARLLRYTGAASVALEEKLAVTQRLLERWARGVPVRGVTRPVSANLAAVVSSGGDPRGWSSPGGMIP